MTAEPGIWLNVRDRVKVVTAKPFLCFEVAEFLPRAFYETLRSAFPSVELCERTSRAGKRMLSPRDAAFAEVVGSNSPWHEFAIAMQSPTFLSECRRLILGALWRSRGLRGLRSWTTGRVANPLRRRLTTEVGIQLEFSFLGNGAGVLPHTDGGSKLVSLILFFADDDSQSNLPWGTEFYRLRDDSARNRWMNFANRQLSDDERKQFYQDFEIFYQPSFEANKLVGFVKNDLSYHALKPLVMPPDVYRKSININVVAS